MLTDIETLQKEIETFHNNVKYSNELTGLLSNIISALKNEEKLFDERIKALENMGFIKSQNKMIGTHDRKEYDNAEKIIQQGLDLGVRTDFFLEDKRGRWHLKELLKKVKAKQN